MQRGSFTDLALEKTNKMRKKKWASSGLQGNKSKGLRESTQVRCRNLVIYCLPNIYAKLLEAVEADNAQLLTV